MVKFKRSNIQGIFLLGAVLLLLSGCSEKPQADTKNYVVAYFEKESKILFDLHYLSEDKNLRIRFFDLNTEGFYTELTFLPTKESKMFFYEFEKGETALFFKGYYLEFIGSSIFKLTKEGLVDIKKIFYFNEPFSITENDFYTDLEGKLEVKVLKFLDSRCTEGNVCVWEGEIGTELSVKGIDMKGGQWTEKIYLGEKTAKEKNFLNYTISLEKIVEEKGRYFATLLIYSKEGQNKVWFTIEPMQCNTNRWDYPNWPVKRLFDSEEERIKEWLIQTQGIEVYEVTSKITAEVVCAACSCPTGKTVAVLVDSFNSGKMITLGWKIYETTFCTQEVKTCPNGTFVVRKPPFCDFEECKNANLKILTEKYDKTAVPNKYDEGVVVCTDDVLECSDGSFVSRIPPSCEFAPCPDTIK